MRPFYLGRIMLAKGMLFDLEGVRENAIMNYERVMENNSAFIDKSLAQTYLDQPFSL